MNESKTEMLARHAREISQSKERHAKELAELKSRWWEEWFTEDPCSRWGSIPCETRTWIKNILPTIIRKREKIGVTLSRDTGGNCYAEWDGMGEPISFALANRLARRTLASGEKHEI